MLKSAKFVQKYLEFGMANEYSQFEKRKQDHIELALMSVNQAAECNIFDSMHFAHEALPDLNFSDVNICSTRFTKAVTSPFMVSSMTAGHDDALMINRNLIAACAKSGWAMGVGSQRRELTDLAAANIWQQVRADYPQVSLFSNIGIAQLINTKHASIERLISALGADALIIHCNALQECIQPEGTPLFKGCWHALEKLVKNLHVPIIIKETGCGFSRRTLQRLSDLGVAAVDISGLGGTHWGRIEGHRAVDDLSRHAAAQTFRNWGINTVHSLREAYNLDPKFEIWGSGGVRNGLDAAKLLALGATTIGFAQPLLKAALDSAEAVYKTMGTIEYELKVAMFCTGSSHINQLQDHICL
jgi:isopentenyl-diphosphate Delta-isomerase